MAVRPVHVLCRAVTAARNGAEAALAVDHGDADATKPLLAASARLSPTTN